MTDMANATDPGDAADPADPTDVADLFDPRTVLLLSLADDELVMGHREAFWIGVAPSLEEDIAFAGISQDEINHADVWYQLVVGDDRAAVDRLGLGRRPEEYRHAVLVERRPAGFADALARHWLYDHADTVRLQALAGSRDSEIAAVARTLAHEERYHLVHADTWFQRIARSGDDARHRLHTAIGAVLTEAQWLFEPLPGEDALVADGVLPAGTAALHDRWLDVVAALCAEAGFDDLIADRSRPEFTTPGGRRGVHSRDWTSDAWPEMTRLHREHAGATW